MTQGPQNPGFVQVDPNVTDIDAPPEAFTPMPDAGQFTEDLEDMTLLESSVGPTQPTIEYTPVGGDTPTDVKPQTTPSTGAVDAKKDASLEDGIAKEKVQTPGPVPYERFKEVNDKAKAFEESHNLLQQIVGIPSVRQALGIEAQVESQRTIDTSVVAAPTDPGDEADDTAKFMYAVQKVAYDFLAPVLKPLADSVSELTSFRGELEDGLHRFAQHDGKPLYPRWDELKPAVKEFQNRYKGLSKQDAYLLADAHVPKTAVDPGSTMPTVEHPTGVVPAAPPPAKRANANAVRARQLFSLSRSMSATQDNVLPSTPAEAAARAMAIVGEPKDE